MKTTEDIVAAGSNPDEVRSPAPTVESPRIREYFDLCDALAEPGCPVCARVLQAGHEVLAALAAEPSHRVTASKAVVTLRGLCNAHAWSIHAIAQEPVPLAEAYELFLRGRIERLRRVLSRPNSASHRSWSGWVRSWGGRALTGLFRWRRLRRCPACRSAEAMERRDLGLLLDLITDMEFARAFEASTGLCLPHLNLVLRLDPEHPNLPRLLEAQIPKVRRLHADLQDFIRRAKAPLVMLTQAERDAIWRRVFEGATGKAGVFGHERDLALEGEGWGITLARARGGVARSAPQSASEEGGGSGMDELERLGLENAKLKRRVVEVSREWAEESARRAALHFQVHKLSEDVKVLELNLAGARGEANAGDVQAWRLRDEIAALQEEIRRLGGREVHPSDSLEDGR